MANALSVPELAAPWREVCAAVEAVERARADREQCNRAREELQRAQAGLAVAVTPAQLDAYRAIIEDEPRRVQALTSAQVAEEKATAKFAAAGSDYYRDQRDHAETRVAEAQQAIVDAQKALADAIETAKGAPTAWKSWVKGRSWSSLVEGHRAWARQQIAKPNEEVA